MHRTGNPWTIIHLHSNYAKLWSVVRSITKRIGTGQGAKGQLSEVANCKLLFTFVLQRYGSQCVQVDENPALPLQGLKLPAIARNLREEHPSATTCGVAKFLHKYHAPSFSIGDTGLLPRLAHAPTPGIHLVLPK